jgi:amino acid permease
MVHMVMYFYYGLAALEYRPWWKKYITKFQLTQFVLLMIHGAWAAYAAKRYNAYLVFDVAYQIIMYVLFTLFYREAYSAKKSVPAEKKESSAAPQQQQQKAKAKKVE